MKNLENIVFDRFHDFLEKHGIKIICIKEYYLCVKEYGLGEKRYRLFLNRKVISSASWASKHNFLFGDSCNEHNIGFCDKSIFKISKTFATFNNNFLRYDESKLAELWPILQQFQADSPEEMLVKMDLIGV